MLTKGIFQETLSKVVLAVAGFVLNMILARELEPAGFGVVGIILSIMFVFELFLTNGLRQAVSKILSSQQVHTKKLWWQSFFIQMGFSLGLVLLGLLVLGKVAEWLQIEQYRNLLYLILVIIPIKGLFFLNCGFLNGQFKYKQHAIANSVYSIFRLAIALVLLYTTGDGVLAVLVGTLAAFVLSLFFTKMEWTNNDSTAVVTNRYLLDLTWGALVFYLLVNIFYNIDVLLLRGLGMTEASVGYYKDSANIGSLLYFLFISVSQASYPMIARLFTRQAWDELSSVVNRLFISIYYTTALAFLFTMLFSDVIISVLFGKPYLPATGVTPWYALSIGMLSVIIMLGNMMIVFEHKKTYLFYLLGSLVLYLVMVVALIGKLEIYTPPVALITVSVLVNILFIAIINRRYNRIFAIKTLLLIIGWLILMTAVALLIHHFLASVIDPRLSGVLVFVAFSLVSLFTIRQVREAVFNSVSVLLGKKK